MTIPASGAVAVPTDELLGPLNQVERKNAPQQLYVAGDRALLRRGTRVSIVGSRKASPAGLDAAATLARALVGRDMIIVSGLAEGIDTAAHEAALGGGGRTIAVLGTPLDRVFPAKNRALQDRIARDHLVVSQFPPGSTVRRWNFPRRNRTMALLSDATVIIEASERSGSLHQGWEALRLGRALFLPEAVLESAVAWAREFERYGAQPLSLTALDLFFEALPDRARSGIPELAF